MGTLIREEMPHGKKRYIYECDKCHCEVTRYQRTSKRTLCNACIKQEERDKAKARQEKHDTDLYNRGYADAIEEVKTYVSKKADEMNMRTKIAEEKSDMMSEHYFSGAMWHLMEVKEFLEQLKEKK